jgi:hypothetical protein
MIRRSAFATVMILVLIALATGATLAQSAAVDRPAAIRAGTCGSLGEEVATLANLVVTAGDPQGQSGAVPVEQSGTVVPFTVSDLLAAPHAVIVFMSPQESGVVVACGEVGGVLNPDGTLAVGMQDVNGSGLSGVAYFTPIDQFQNTLVTILLVGNGGASSAQTSEEGLTKDAVPGLEGTE